MLHIYLYMCVCVCACVCARACVFIRRIHKLDSLIPLSFVAAKVVLTSNSGTFADYERGSF
jgi:glutathionyl-hydroquinone reductase